MHQSLILAPHHRLSRCWSQQKGCNMPPRQEMDRRIRRWNLIHRTCPNSAERGPTLLGRSKIYCIERKLFATYGVVAWCPFGVRNKGNNGYRVPQWGMLRSRDIWDNLGRYAAVVGTKWIMIMIDRNSMAMIMLRNGGTIPAGFFEHDSLFCQDICLRFLGLAFSHKKEESKVSHAIYKGTHYASYMDFSL